MEKNFKFNGFKYEQDDKNLNKLEDIVDIGKRSVIYISESNSKNNTNFVDVYVYMLNKRYGGKVLFLTENGNIEKHIGNIIIKNYCEKNPNLNHGGTIDAPKEILETFILREKKEKTTFYEFNEQIKEFVKKENVKFLVIDSLSVEDFNFDDKPNYDDRMKKSSVLINIFRLKRKLGISIILPNFNTRLMSSINNELEETVNENKEINVVIDKIDYYNGRKINYVSLIVE